MEGLPKARVGSGVGVAGREKVVGLEAKFDGGYKGRRSCRRMPFG